jgi:hypothetical protein
VLLLITVDLLTLHIMPTGTIPITKMHHFLLATIVAVTIQSVVQKMTMDVIRIDRQFCS